MLKYEVFSKLYDETFDYDNVEMYIAERGWQDWMNDFADEDDYDASIIAMILNRIWNLSHASIKELRGGTSQVSFCCLYGIPRRTLQDWEYNKNEVPSYTKKLIAYTKMEDLKK